MTVIEATPTTPPLTLNGLLQEAARRLADAGVEGPRAEARWLMARTLGLSESALLAHGDRPVDAIGAARVRNATERRAAREPFAYIVGEREFYGRSFLVDHRVLVPRPETESLIEEALRVLAGSGRAQPLVVDVGTGSGAIACTIALEAPHARVIACDVSADALTVAAANRNHLGPGGFTPSAAEDGTSRRRHDDACHSSGCLALVRGSLLSWLGQPADLVLANLPYLPSGRLPTLMPEVRDWEPHLALDGGPAGLDLIAELLADAHRTVRPGGSILLELDPEQVEPARALLPNATARVIRDLAGLDRVLRLDLPG